MLDRLPDQSLIVGETSNRAVDRLAATRGADGSYAFIYFPAGKKSATVQTDKLSGETLVATWYDPRTGKAGDPETLAKSATHEFAIPANSTDDWVLVIDDAAKKIFHARNTAGHQIIK